MPAWCTVGPQEILVLAHKSSSQARLSRAGKNSFHMFRQIIGTFQIASYLANRGLALLSSGMMTLLKTLHAVALSCSLHRMQIDGAGPSRHKGASACPLSTALTLSCDMGVVLELCPASQVSVERFPLCPVAHGVDSCPEHTSPQSDHTWQRILLGKE